MALAVPSEAPYLARGMLDLEAEVGYWRDYYAQATPTVRFDAYEPAIRLGIQACLHAHGRSFEEMSPELGDHYEQSRQDSALAWRQARSVALASWQRIERAHAAMHPP